MRLLKQGDTPEPGVWRSIDQKQIDKWREKVKRDLATKPKGSIMYEYDTGRTQGLTPADTTASGDAIFEMPKPMGIREPRDTINVLIKGTLDWVRGGNKDDLRQRVKLLQESGKFAHLSLDEAVSQIGALAEKMAKADAERVYAERGYGRPVQL